MHFTTGARSGSFFNNDMIKKISLTKNFDFLVVLSNAGGLKVILIYKYLVIYMFLALTSKYEFS